MTKDRENVLMLLLRKRRYRSLLRKYKDTAPDEYVSMLLTQENEAHNAAELARRILYEIEL